MKDWVKNAHQDEFGLRDPLAGRALGAVISCPDCGSRPVFFREGGGDSTLPFRYRVGCPWETANWDENPCKERATPWLPSLALAVRHWTLSIKLAK